MHSSVTAEQRDQGKLFPLASQEKKQKTKISIPLPVVTEFREPLWLLNIVYLFSPVIGFYFEKYLFPNLAMLLYSLHSPKDAFVEAIVLYEKLQVLLRNCSLVKNGELILMRN